MDKNLYLNYCGFGSPSTENWRLSQDLEIQRFYYILDGTGGYISADGKRHPFKKGHVYLFPYNLRHNFYNDTSSPVVHLYFDFLSAPPIISQEPLAIPVDQNSELYDALSLARKMLSLRKGQPPAKTERHLLKLLLDLLEEQVVVPFNTDEVICQAVKTIQDNYARSVSVGELAKEAGFEVNYFIRRFNKVMKQTPYAYLKNYRLIMAENLISEGVSIDKTAEQVGYESSASLIRALRRLQNK